MTAVSALELTPENWDELTAHKTVFLKFLEPWCNHCKAMKPAWDKLMGEFKDHKFVGVYAIDCTAAGKPLCDSHDVRSFPTLMYGDPNNLESYAGRRSYEPLKNFTYELKPICSLGAQLATCSEEQRAQIDKFTGMEKDALEAYIAKSEEAIADLEAMFTAKTDKLHDKYEALQQEKDDAIAAIRASGIGVAKSVLFTLEESLDTLNEGPDTLDESLHPLDESLDPVDESLDTLDESHDTLEASLDPLGEIIDPLDESVDPLDESSL